MRIMLSLRLMKAVCIAPAVLVTSAALGDPGRSALTEVEDALQDLPPGVHKQSEEEALAHDLALIAKAAGWSLEQAKLHRLAADEVGRIANELAQSRPDILVGSKLSQVPEEPAILYVKGRAPDFVRELVASSKHPIRLADGQPFSLQELEAREQRISRALRERGLQALTSFRLDGRGVVDAEVAEHLSVRGDQVAAALPPDLRESVALSVVPADSFANFNMLGGVEVWNDIGLCTTGFAVRGSWGYEGAVTAAHCGPDLHTVVEPGVATLGCTVANSHNASWGDVQLLYESNNDWYQVDWFYPYADVVRDVTVVEPAGAITENEFICGYGRVTNMQDCRRVKSVSASCGSASRLVRMHGNGFTFGDSGGPWYIGTRAYGIVKGMCSGDAMWTVADYFDEALGVTVMTTP